MFLVMLLGEGMVWLRFFEGEFDVMRVKWILLWFFWVFVETVVVWV